MRTRFSRSLRRGSGEIKGWSVAGGAQGLAVKPLLFEELARRASRQAQVDSMEGVGDRQRPPPVWRGFSRDLAGLRYYWVRDHARAQSSRILIAHRERGLGRPGQGPPEGDGLLGQRVPRAPKGRRTLLAGAVIRTWTRSQRDRHLPRGTSCVVREKEGHDAIMLLLGRSRQATLHTTRRQAC